MTTPLSTLNLPRLSARAWLSGGLAAGQGEGERHTWREDGHKGQANIGGGMRCGSCSRRQTDSMLSGAKSTAHATRGPCGRPPRLSGRFSRSVAQWSRKEGPCGGPLALGARGSAAL
jgi:hypothetical protein